MPTIIVTSSICDQFTGGLESFEVAADTVRGLIRELDARYPGMGDYIQRHTAIAIDGDIYQDAWLQKLRPDSEVYLIPRIAGG